MVARETRILLVTIAVSLAALWLLARARFQDRPATALPVPPVLAQLRPQSTFDDLAGSLSDLRARLSSTTIVMERGVVALRTGRSTAIVLSASGLRLVPAPSADGVLLSAWIPRVADYPRFLVAVDPFGDGIALRPVFVGSMAAFESPVWKETIWRLPPDVPLLAGTFVVTTGGLLAGLAVNDAGERALLPGSAVLTAAEQLREQAPRPAGHLGIQVQEMPLGLVAAWVDPKGSATTHVMPTDVIEAINGQGIRTAEQWDAHVNKLEAGDSVVLRVRSRDTVREVTLSAVETVPRLEEIVLGLTMRTVRGSGVMVTAVQTDSAGARAGVQVGDLLTVIDGQVAPSAAQVTRAFEDLGPGASLLVALTRGGDRRVTAFEK